MNEFKQHWILIENYLHLPLLNFYIIFKNPQIIFFSIWIDYLSNLSFCLPKTLPIHTICSFLFDVTFDSDKAIFVWFRIKIKYTVNLFLHYELILEEINLFTWTEKVMTKLFCRNSFNLMNSFERIYDHSIHLFLSFIHFHLTVFCK